MLFQPILQVGFILILTYRNQIDVQKDGSQGEKFVELLIDESLSQSVDFSTYRKANLVAENTLDLVISESPDRIKCRRVLQAPSGGV